jgi:hypothetical protein
MLVGVRQLVTYFRIFKHLVYYHHKTDIVFVSTTLLLDTEVKSRLSKGIFNVMELSCKQDPERLSFRMYRPFLDEISGFYTRRC